MGVSSWGIRHYVAWLDPQALGLHLNVFISISLKRVRYKTALPLPHV
jgi:DNA-binding Lrp family transcriptional regulator